MNKKTTNQQYWTMFIVQRATCFVLSVSYHQAQVRSMWKTLTYKFCCVEGVFTYS